MSDEDKQPASQQGPDPGDQSPALRRALLLHAAAAEARSAGVKRHWAAELPQLSLVVDPVLGHVPVYQRHAPVDDIGFNQGEAE